MCMETLLGFAQESEKRGMTPEERKVYMHRYYLKNKAHLKRYRRAWYLRNAERINYERRVRYYSDPEFRQWDIKRHLKH